MPSKDKYTSVSVDLSGPLFEVDPGKRVIENIRDFLEALADYGQEHVRKDIAAKAGRMPNYTGWTYDRVRGRVESTTRRKWYLHAVVSAYTADLGRTDAIRTKAAAASIERRWHPFRRAAFASRAQIKKLDLAKGLN